MRTLRTNVPRTVTRAALSLATTGLAVGLAGCGGTDSPATATAPTTSAAASPASPTAPASGAASTTSLPAPATPAGCGPADVTVTPDEVLAEASTRSVRLSVRSATGEDCELTDQAQATLLDAAGAAVTTPLEEGGLPPGRQPITTLPGDFEGGVSTTVAWRVVPGAPGADPATDCPSGTLGLVLSEGAGPLDTGVQITACEQGSLQVQPYDINAG